ncbi:MAG: hydantoinase/oxoprolinase family protein [Methanoregulaceae archaeon]|jgi:probable H4MPT-linked C1 transfer pathway protein
MIGIDVGGANLKLVDDTDIIIHYCPLWKGAPLVSLLEKHRTQSNNLAAVVMSGELADCFREKSEGISFIVRSVKKVFPNAKFYGTDGLFHNDAVPQLAAANWLASADYLRTIYPDAVLLDVGSTTTDIIPLSLFSNLKGLTDIKRLQKGYLIYTGLLRTSIPTLLRTVTIDGIPTPLSSEFFAISADVHLVLSHIKPNQYSCDTPDQKGKTKISALRRLARVVCADLDEIGKQNALGIADQFWQAQRNVICDQVRKVMLDSNSSKVIISGIGSELFVNDLDGIDLSEKLGQVANALPAFAVKEVALRDHIL